MAYTKKRYIDHIRVEPSTVNLLMATTELYAKAYAVWSDGTEEDVTSQATWSNQGYRTDQKWNGNYYYQFRYTPTGESYISLNVAKRDNSPGMIRLVSDKDVTSRYAAGNLPANIMKVEYAGFTAYMYGTFNVTSIVFSMYINGAWVSSGGPYEVKRNTVIPMRAEATDGTVTNDLFNIIKDGVKINGTKRTSYTAPADISSTIPIGMSASFGGVTSNTVSLIGKPVPTFAGLEIAPAPLYYDGENFIIKDNDWNHDSYDSIYGMEAGSYYFTWVECNESLNSVTYEGLDDWRLPTAAELTAVTTGSRTGSNINGTTGCRYALIQLSDVTHAESSTPTGLLLAPDGETMTGMAKTFNWNVQSTSGNTGVTAAQLEEYITEGCVFLPASGGFYTGKWRVGAVQGMYWTSDGSSASYCSVLNFRSSSISSGSVPRNYYLTCRLVRTAE